MNSLVRLLLPDVQDLLREGTGEDIASALAPFHSADIADLMEQLEDLEAGKLLLGLGGEQQVMTFEQLEGPEQVRLVESLGPDAVLSIITKMSSDDRADLMADLSVEVASALLRQLPPEEAKDVALLGSYEEETAGGIMTSEFVSLSPDMTVAEAVERVREQATSKELVYALYVRDDEGRLQGVVTLIKLILGKADTKVGEVMYPNPISVGVTDDQETVMRKLRHYDFLAMPVLDRQGRMVGIVTHDDLLDVAIEEADEDAQRMGGVQPLQESYFATRLMTLVRKRAALLVILFMTELVAGAVLHSFGETLQKTVALILFLPVVIASGGNSGSQSATLVIRGLAVGDISLTDWWRLAKREFVSGLFLGAILGTFGAALARAVVDDWQHVAVIIWLTLTAVVTIGSLLGSLLPLLLQRLSLDPAITSTPLVAALVDILGLVTYVSVAWTVLAYL